MGALVFISAFFFLPAAISYGVSMDADAPSFYVSTLAGGKGKGFSDGKGIDAKFNWPTGVAVKNDGAAYVADFLNNLVRRVDASGKVTTVAGTGGIGSAGFADGEAGNALFHGPDNIAIDKEGNLYVADADNFRIRKITPRGAVTTIAGDGTMGYRDGRAMEARFGYPTGIAVDNAGDVYVADRRSHTVRKISFKSGNGEVTTVAGNGFAGYIDGKGSMSMLREPISVVVGGDGTAYVADSGNNAIRKITPDGVVKTLSGGKKAGYRDGAADEAMFSWPTGIALDPSGVIYVCDSNNNKIRRITPSGVVSTVAGGLIPGRLDGPGFVSSFNFPTGIALDSSGNIYVADSGNNAIRRITRGSVDEVLRLK